jgi:hypothetical protein
MSRLGNNAMGYSKEHHKEEADKCPFCQADLSDKRLAFHLENCSEVYPDDE